MWNSRLAPPLFFLPGLLFEGSVRLRASLYARGFMAKRRLPRPIVSIGNLTLGGTGKTPLAIYLARVLRSWGFTPALLSRGYGRRSGQLLIVPPGDAAAVPAEVGDEPALIRRSVPEIWLGISADRFRAGIEIVRREPRAVFLLDDGFQHLKLHRDLDIVMIDASRPLHSDCVIPRGSLREPLSALHRSDVVMLNGRGVPGAERPLADALHRFCPSAQIFHCAQPIEGILPFSEWLAGTLSRRLPQFQSAFLVCAVANPARFRRDVEALQISIVGERFFRDHYSLTPEDWHGCARQAQAGGAQALLVTEKDAVKLRREPNYPVMVAVQGTRIEELPDFEIILRKTCEEAG